jgi:hypothetical protein
MVCLALFFRTLIIYSDSFASCKYSLASDAAEPARCRHRCPKWGSGREDLAMEKIVEIARAGTHVLVRQGARFAVVERRGGKVYGVDRQDSEGYAPDEAGFAAAVGGAGWMDEASARERLRAIARRGEELARKLW